MRRITPTRELFEKYVDRSGGPDACWPWTGSYGKGKPHLSTCDPITKRKSSIAPRRLAWLYANKGPLARKRFVQDTCGHSNCMNPKHLRVPTLEDRFWERVDKNGPVMRPELGPCWIWIGAINHGGYGDFYESAGKKTAASIHMLAHAYSWELANGRAKRDGFYICHHCDHPRCVRPEHLFEGTAKDNSQDMLAKGRARHQKMRRASGDLLTKGKDHG